MTAANGRSCRCPLAMGLAVMLWANSVAAQVEIAAGLTDLSSTSERVISYRFQEHMWQTPDGATHAMINRGLYSPGATLVLHSSYDGGSTWAPKATYSQSDLIATSDGQLSGNDLHVVYSDSNLAIRYNVVRYQAALRRWASVRGMVVAESGGVTRQGPACALDNQGGIWCSFVTRDAAIGRAAIELAYLRRLPIKWSGTLAVVGPVDNASFTVERSARPIRLSDGMGLIYTVHNTFYFAKRLDGWSLDAPWSSTRLFDADLVDDVDPYESHFSVARDGFGNTHLATTSGGKVVYSRLVNGAVAWEPLRILADLADANFVKVSAAGGQVLVVANNTLTTSGVYASNDQGQSFALTYNLSHAALQTSNNAILVFPRVEMPSTWNRSPIVLQQYRELADAKLMAFRLP